jgi:hypothetical protein
MAPWIFSPSLSLDLSIHHGHRHNEALAERTDGEMQGRAEWANSDCRIMMILGLAVPTLTFSIKIKQGGGRSYRPRKIADIKYPSLSRAREQQFSSRNFGINRQ